MKGIIVTQDNMASIYGKLKKFFNHNKFISWHNFDQGSKRKIRKHIFIDKRKVDTTINLKRPVSIELDPNFGRLIRVRLTDVPYRAFVIVEGDKIKFDGSKIIIKSKFILQDLHKYIYRVFQIAK